jgi:hypothetical protein
MTMDNTTKTREKDLWEDIRETVRHGVRELRNAGDELARQGRLRMDVFQTERRMKNACETLGEICYRELSENRPVNTDNTSVAELVSRIKYYQDELVRLREEQKKAPENAS